MRNNLTARLQHQQQAGKKSLAVLIDPDKVAELDDLLDLVNLANDSGVDYFFVGGSLITNEMLHPVIRLLKATSDIPVLLFPGHHTHVDDNADAILFLSLLSGRNPEYLIGQQVMAAKRLKHSDIEVIPTAYLLVGSAADSSVAYVSNTLPIPYHKAEIAASTALAGEFMGMKVIYLDAGSGVKETVPPEMISNIRKTISTPLIVGGGIRNESLCHEAFAAGADVVVVGNQLEDDPGKLSSMVDVTRKFNSLNVH